MMDFMVIGLARSGTTWASNWLMDQGAICLHDPLSCNTVDDLISFKPGRIWGVSCTALWVHGNDVLNRMTTRRVILSRDADERRADVESIGLGVIPFEADELAKIEGKRYDFRDLFNPVKAKEIWEYLRPDAPFDAERHALLCEMKIQPEFDAVHITKAAVDEFCARIGSLQ